MGSKKGSELWKKLKEVETRFHIRYPQESFPPVFVFKPFSGLEFFSDNVAYGSNAINKKDASGKRDATDKYEAMLIGEHFIKTRSVDETVAAACHELGHDVRNHMNQQIEIFNKKGSIAKSVMRSQECEADMIGIQLHQDKKGLISVVEKAEKRAGTRNHVNPYDDHPSGKQRADMMRLPNILMADPKRTHFNDRCEIIDKPFVPSDTPSVPANGKKTPASR